MAGNKRPVAQLELWPCMFPPKIKRAKGVRVKRIQSKAFEQSGFSFQEVEDTSVDTTIFYSIYQSYSRLGGSPTLKLYAAMLLRVMFDCALVEHRKEAWRWINARSRKLHGVLYICDHLNINYWQFVLRCRDKKLMAKLKYARFPESIW